MMYLWQYYATFSQTQHQIALYDEQGQGISWYDLNKKINELSAYFFQQGVRESNGIALCGKNCIELLLAYLATIQLGARVLGVNPAFSDEKIQRICEDNDIKFYYDASKQKTLRNLTALYFPIEKSDLQQIYSAEYDQTRPATMTLTSGSTGTPKAVVHNIQAHLENAQGVCELMCFKHESSWLLSLPLYHVSGQGILWRWLLTGAILYLSQEDFYYTATSVSHLSFVPTQLERFLTYLQNNPNSQDKTQHILLGGTQIPLKLIQEAEGLGIICYSGYGMTEMASTVCAKRSNHHDGVGKPLVGREVKIINNEIYLRGAGLGLGYWHKGNIVPFTDENGWFRSKDLGIWRDNELAILGRLDNMFISGGENIQPEEIETLILRNPTVEQVFILPIEDGEFGSRPVAMIAFYNGFSQDKVESLRAWLFDRLEKFKHPLHYFPLDMTLFQQQGNIKISRGILKLMLQAFLGK